MTKRLLLLLPALALALAGCADAGHTDADVEFAQQMIPHHEQAVEMADIAAQPERGASSDVKELAERIKTAQDPEITEMKGFLDDWDAKEASSMQGMSGMQGMVSDEGLDDLREASGEAFDRAWLRDMIGHHEGAITMAQAELKSGEDEDAKKLARTIITVQRDEIAEMKELLA